MSIPKYHHYVPICHLKGFTDSASKFCVYQKNTKKLLRNQKPDNHFGQNHLNTHYEKSGSKDVSLEHELSTLEARTAPLFERIRKISNNVFKPQLNYEDKLKFAEYFYNQFSRHPDFFDDTHSEQQVASHLAQFIAESGYELTSNEKAQMLSSDEVKRIRQNAIVATRRTTIQSTIARLASFDFAIAYSKSADLIIGDNPIAHFIQTEQIPFNNWMPISLRTAIAPTFPLKCGTQYIELSKQQTAEINFKILEKSSRLVATKDEKVLRQITNYKKTTT
ncbi:DUF4238 domain-containing protein [Pseudovibrio ascidiaceicola]|uniref:DUF4238 domain-containing protein n=1 Tax=Pseudovibrio ascidiaceicola TaxID=285279 RepID=UPI003D35AEDD